jgi:exodeoxyribonuclease-3
MKIVSWNVNGIRAIVKKGFRDSVNDMDPDVLCLQETKATVEEVKTVAQVLDQFSFVSANQSKTRKGYSGTAILSKTQPLQVTYDMGFEEHDQEGRIITSEFENFYLVTVYTPNSGRGLVRLDYREEWDKVFRTYIKDLEKTKPVVICGDLNVAHTEIDLANPKNNYNKSAGYTQREIDGLEAHLNAGFTDTWRHLYPEEIKYSYWNYMFNARTNNKGWRIDYFLVSNSFLPEVKDAGIHNEFFGSDHCPVSLELR